MTKFKMGGNPNGTCLQGYVATTYSDLVAIFGEPTISCGDKTTAEWIVTFGSGKDKVVATIYDWKEYETPMGKYDWHIGGNSSNAVDLVHGVMAEYQNMVCEQLSGE